MLFDVRVTAFNAHAGVDPVEALMRLFKIDRGFAHEVVHRLPRVIKRAVPLETAQRLAQILERIGGRVEIVVSERTQGPGASPARARAARQDASVQRGSTPRTTAGRGLPPPSAAVLAQSPMSPSAAESPSGTPAAMRKSLATAASPRAGAGASLPNGSPDDAAMRAVSGLLEARSARGQREHRPTHRENPFEAEMSSAAVRSALRDSVVASNLAARPSLPLSDLSEVEAEASQVTQALGRPSLPPPVPDNDAERSGRPPPGKPGVKEPLARPSLPQSGVSGAPERVSRGPGDLAPPGASGPPLTLPSFPARGASLADEIEALPETLALRKRYRAITLVLFALASLASAGLFAVGMTLKLVATRRRRLAQLRELSASALLVGQSQLPELYHCLKQLAIRLEISPSPRLYIAEHCPDKIQSFNQRGTLVIVLDARLLSSAARFNAGYIVQFALAHAIAAYALDQHTWSRQLLSQLWDAVAKSELFSADALAAKLMSGRNEPVRALASLLCGPELAHLVDLNELEQQATSQAQEAKQYGDRTEGASYLLPRIQRLRRVVQAKS